MLDIKHLDPSEHLRGTGQDNRRILANLALLISSGRTFVARVPLLPGYNDSAEHLGALAERLAPARGRVRVELLPSNPLAGAKHALLGFRYRPFHPEVASPRRDLEPFHRHGIAQ